MSLGLTTNITIGSTGWGAALNANWALLDALKLDGLNVPTDVTTLDATTAAHGLLPKLGGGTTNFLRADGSWAAPAGATAEFGFGCGDGVNPIPLVSNVALPIAYSGTITGWTLVADQAGAVVIDVKKASYSAFPSTSSICASALPTLSAAQKNTDSTLTGWTTAFSAGDIFTFTVNSSATITRVVLTLKVVKS